MLVNKRRLSAKSKLNSRDWPNNRDWLNSRGRSSSRKSSRRERLLRLSVVRLKNKTDSRCSRSSIIRRALICFRVSSSQPMLRNRPQIKQCIWLPTLSRTPQFTTE